MLTPLLQQFQAMQQQMFDQFHEGLMAMAQVFTTLHHEQLAALRDELGQLRKLTEEIQDLRAELREPSPQPALLGGLGVATASAGDGLPVAGQAPSGPPLSDSPRDRKPAPGPEVSRDVHLWLAQRIATLQQDRQNRWDRLLQTLKGG
jgi:hypothetical protein